MGTPNLTYQRALKISVSAALSVPARCPVGGCGAPAGSFPCCFQHWENRPAGRENSTGRLAERTLQAGLPRELYRPAGRENYTGRSLLPPREQYRQRGPARPCPAQQTLNKLLLASSSSSARQPARLPVLEP